MPKNLNSADPIQNEFMRLDNISIENQVASVSVYFREIREALIFEIKKADAVFGCVAWINDPQIVAALELKKVLSIVISEVKNPADISAISSLRNKANFVRLGDLATSSNHFYTLISDPDFDRPQNPEDQLESIRQVKSASVDVPLAGLAGYERMHNKFLVFAKFETHLQSKIDISNYFYASGSRNKLKPAEFLEAFDRSKLKPYAVWTGSFNFTNNASNSFENASLLTNEILAEKFFREYSQIYLLSESI